MTDKPATSDQAPPRTALHPLGILIVEDSPDDLDLLLLALRRAGYAPDYRCVRSAEETAQALNERPWDIVLSDYTLPDYSGLMALHQVQAFDPDMPFIIVSGNIGEDVAVAAMKAGAHDYLIKGNFARLGAAIEREVKEAESRRARRRSEQELREAKLRLQALSNRMLQMQEAERRHIARELHDEIGQSLTAMKLNLDALQRRLLDHAALPLALEVTDITELLLDQVRKLSLDLRPPQLDDLGLSAALNWLVKRHSLPEGPAIVLDAPEALPRLDPLIETAGFRVAQEALTNALRHARAAEIRIALGFAGNCFELSVRDDGAGFDLPTAQDHALRGGSLGLVGMRERAVLAGGTLRIATRPNEGTEVVVSFPGTASASSGD
jgi:signal transduction histidine kinase